MAICSLQTTFFESKANNNSGYTTAKTVCRAVFTMKQSSSWDVAKGRPLFFISVTLSFSLSLLQPADDTL